MLVLISRNLLWILGFMAMALGATGNQEAPIVSTLNGQVLGLQEQSTKGRLFYSYYSIPFARPPVGNLRFKDPVPAPAWNGILDSKKPPPVCLQLADSIIDANNTVIGEEDCLYLSVFTHKHNEVNAKTPVLVWIHGGAYYTGGSSQYPPHVLMNEDIVLVIIQFRVGILGFLSTEDTVIPGNFGLKDQTEALRWVSRNIMGFGGDPSKVTIFGESSGAASVHFQILSPKSDGLFARAIMQSGSAMSSRYLGGAHRDVAFYTSKLVNCPIDVNTVEILQCLQQASGERLVSTLSEYFEWLRLPLLVGPRVDGDYLPSDPNILVRDGMYEKVDIISGVNTHEGSLLCLPMYAQDHSREALVKNFSRLGPVAMDFSHRDPVPLASSQMIFDHYLGGVNVHYNNADDVVKMFTDRYFTVSHDLMTIFHIRNTDNHKTFRYELVYRGQHSFTDSYNLKIGKQWVSHGDDLYYLFTGDKWNPITQPDDLKLRDIFTRLWANFAATGNPTPDNSLGFKWEAATETNLHHLSLSSKPTMEPDHRTEVRKFFASLSTLQNEILDGKGLPGMDTHTASLKFLSDMAKEAHFPSQETKLQKPTKLTRDEF